MNKFWLKKHELSSKTYVLSSLWMIAVRGCAEDRKFLKFVPSGGRKIQKNVAENEKSPPKWAFWVRASLEELVGSA
jgi:hypothetical protein